MIYNVTVYVPVKSCLPTVSATHRRSQRARHLILPTLLRLRSGKFRSKLRSDKFLLGSWVEDTQVIDQV